MIEKPQQLALRYAASEWMKLTKSPVVPFELANAIVRIVMVAGYTRKSVDDLIAAYRKKQREESK